MKKGILYFFMFLMLLPKIMHAEENFISQGGVCVEIDIKNLSNINQLIKSKNILIQGIVTEEKLMAQLKEELLQQNIYGKVSIDYQNLSLLPYESNLINLVIINDLEKITALGFKLEEAFRILTPNGKIKFTKSVSEEQLKKAGFINIQKHNNFISCEKPRPKEMDEWTHSRYSPERTATSKDLLVGPSDSMRWLDEPRRYRSKPVAGVTANGKFFYVYDYAPPFTNVPALVELVARDAFNGMIIWRKPIKASRTADVVNYNGNAVAVNGDFLYAPLESDGTLNKIDANTGAVIKAYQKTKPISIILFQKEILILDPKSLKLLSEATGEVIWDVSINSKNCEIAIYKNKAFSFSSNTLICYDIKTGATIWEAKNAVLAMRRNLLVGFIDDLAIVSNEKLFGLSLKDGSQTWVHDYRMSPRGSAVNVFFSQNKIWVHHMGINEKDAKKAEEPKDGNESFQTPGKGQVWRAINPKDGSIYKEIPANFVDKCATGKATERFLISGRMSFTDTNSEKSVTPESIRAACTFGPLPANGLIYNFPTNCRCYPHVKGILATATLDGKTDLPPPEKNKLIKGNGAISKKESSENDWPMYRKDNQRLGSQKFDGPKNPKIKWSQQLNGELTPASVACGKVFVCAKDMHTLYALQEEDGKVLWRYTTGGRLISPPTYYNGALFLGCNDGWAYSISAEDGKLIWKFRIAPNSRKIIAYNQLESLWPMTASIIAHDNKVFLAAGRHTGLDGGIFICALKADSGELIWESKLNSLAVLDIFVLQNQALRLGTNTIDINTGQPIAKRAVETLGNLYLSPGKSSPFDNNVYANRTAWVYGNTEGQMVSVHGDKVIGFTSFSPEGLLDRKREANAPGQGQFKLFTGNPQGRGDFNYVLPIRPDGIVVAGDYVYLAGREDLYPASKSILLTYHLQTNKEVATHVFAESPTFDGLVVANGKIFISTKEGKLICFDSK